MKDITDNKTKATVEKKPYHKPEITSEALCSNMALCGCDPDTCKSGSVCDAAGLEVYPS